MGDSTMKPYDAAPAMPAPVMPAAPSLPAPWQAVPEVDAAGQPTGRTYFHNTATNEVSWDVPVAGVPSNQSEQVAASAQPIDFRATEAENSYITHDHSKQA